MGTDENQPAPKARSTRKVRRAETWLLGGTTALTLGIALCLTEWNDLGAQLTLAGFVAAVAGLHLLGRTGPAEQA